MEKGLIELIRLPLLRPLFPKWYKDDTCCDYHVGNPGHSLKNWTTFKYKVQKLIQDGKVKFEKLNEQDEVGHSLLNFSRAKGGMTKGNQDDKIKRKGVGCSSTTLKPKEQPYEAVGAKAEPMEWKKECLQEEMKTLQNLIQNLEQIFNEKKKYVTALRGEHNRRIMK